VTFLSKPSCKLRSLDLHHQFLEQQRQERRQRLLRGGGNVGGDGTGIVVNDDINENGGRNDSISSMGLECLVRGWQPRGFRNNKSLRRLVLSGNRVGDDDIPHICLLLRRLTGLQELDLDSNQISDRGMSLLANHHDNIPSRLRVLRLSQNPITRRSAQSVIRILEIHPELHTLVTPVYWQQSIGGDKNKEEGARISHLFDINQAGRVLLLQPQSSATRRALPLAAWAKVLARVNFVNNNWNSYFWRGSRFARENGIYYLLRHGPVLMERRGGEPLSSYYYREELDSTPKKHCKKRKRDDACA